MTHRKVYNTFMIERKPMPIATERKRKEQSMAKEILVLIMIMKFRKTWKPSGKPVPLTAIRFFKVYSWLKVYYIPVIFCQILALPSDDAL